MKTPKYPISGIPDAISYSGAGIDDQCADGGRKAFGLHQFLRLDSRDCKPPYCLPPAMFDVALDVEYHNSDFNWFDPVRPS